ncbi:beta-lactamase/transpeptidase-like protein [Periconia macrospinosa]|uniref:Beta-lactamase/transpeptidase-like protein n=1 Tax=Periconia macrospinosa TaxID=97972 RepID=A0A2V1DRV9_9PLEO|nr:beta-lactamase/transpeptidase-like protein [Periconia macrospinosa]
MADILITRLEAHSPAIAELLRVSGAPGLSYGIIHHGRIVRTVHMGRQDFAFPECPNDNSIYYVASTFKVVTAAIVARLVTDGLLAWDTPIHQYLPTLRRTDDFGQNATLKDLLSNRTGLPMANCYWGQQNGEQLIEKSQFLEMVNCIDAVEPMRSSFIYSQWNYALIQLIVERVAAKSFADYAREVVFEPLGLTTATFDEPASKPVQAHACRDDGSPSYVIQNKFNSSGGLASGMGGKCSFMGSMILVPGTRSGVVVMTNATPLMDVSDYSAQLLLAVLMDVEPPQNFLELSHVSARMQLGWFTQIQTALQTFKTDTPPTLPLSAYSGTYFNAHHNFKIVVTVLDTGLRMSMQGLSTAYDVKPYDGDSFYFEANRELELIDRGMWFYPFPQFRVFHFEVNDGLVSGFTWQHDRLMDPETFTKAIIRVSSKI